VADLFDKLDTLTDSLGRALDERAGGGFGALVQQPGRQARDWSSLLGGGNGVAFGSLVGPTQAGPGWADMALGGFGNGFSWSGASAGYSQRGPFDLAGFDEWDTLKNRRAAEEAAKNEYGQGQAVGARIPGGTGAAGASGWLATQRADSPIVGIADEVAAYAASKGVDPGVVFGLLRKESQYGADGAMGIRSNNPGNIMGAGADPANGVIILQQFPDLLTGTKAIVDLLAGYGATYGAKTLEDMIAIYYVGPEAYKRFGLEANDAGGSGPGGNGTVRQYLEQHIYPVTRSYNSRPGAQRPGYGGPAVGLASLFGGQGYGTSQGFGRTPFSTGAGAGIYDFGSEFGLDGDSHTGWDIATPDGTPFYMPAGLSGTVSIAGGSGVYTDDRKGNAPGTGELRITLDNGTILILGHNSGIDVRAGQRVTAGMLLGRTGVANGAHIHIEVRVPDPSLPHGYRIVDPATLFGGGGGGSSEH
jgi:murein DD-endopeptidase MepM/ murein hydrolase activator NlpD